MGPLDSVARNQDDGSSARVRPVGHQLVIADQDLPDAVSGVVVTATAADGIETEYRVHERYPVEDGLTHVLALAAVKSD